MEWVIYCVNTFKNKKINDKKILLQCTNQVRQYEKVMIPCELFGLSGNKLSQCGLHVFEKSPIKWNHMEIEEVIPEPKSTNVWKKFQAWLRTKKPVNVHDFQKDSTNEWLISNNQENFLIRIYIQVLTEKFAIIFTHRIVGKKFSKTVTLSGAPFSRICCVSGHLR